jgi:hypothetical protein
MKNQSLQGLFVEHITHFYQPFHRSLNELFICHETQGLIDRLPQNTAGESTLVQTRPMTF